jgi:iron-sulfur cluster assembly protein
MTTTEAVKPPRKFSVLSLTERAAERVRELVEDNEKSLIGVRVGVRNSGCAGMAYTLDPVETPVPGDDVINEYGVSVYVDPKAVLFLLGSTMDFEATKLRTGFTFKNPNEVSACGCGESVMLEPASESAEEAAAH